MVRDRNDGTETVWDRNGGTEMAGPKWRDRIGGTETSCNQTAQKFLCIFKMCNEDMRKAAAIDLRKISTCISGVSKNHLMKLATSKGVRLDNDVQNIENEQAILLQRAPSPQKHREKQCRTQLNREKSKNCIVKFFCRNHFVM